MEIISKEYYDKLSKDYKGIFNDFRGDSPELNGRRTWLKKGVLLTEGVHFLVDGDYSHLPTLCKETAHIGNAYRFCNGYMILNSIETLSDEFMKEHELYYREQFHSTAYFETGVYEMGGALT